MPWSLWAIFAGTEALLCLTPGPAVLFVVSHGLARGGRAALWANAGIIAGNSFYFFLSALGLSALLLASHRVFTVLQYGGAYLVYLGVQTMRGEGLALLRDSTTRSETEGWRTFSRGFALQVANPKALLFFAALLPQFISTRAAIAPQMIVLATTSQSIELCTLTGYGYLAARAAHAAKEPRFVRLTNRVSGGLLMAAGVGLGLASKR
jgi:homoserine/homoserine lactone efflux protein